MIAIEFNNISKQYRLGLVSTGTLSHDLNRFWQTKILRHEDPYLKIGETNDRTSKGTSEYVWALRDIDFKVDQGDVIGIIGRNGAGKSTLLKLLSRVTSPTMGTIRARGRIASLLEVGTGFHPEMTGRENIYMNGSIMGLRKVEIDKKLDEIVDFSGCERYIDTPVKRYSSGMKVRLGFAIAAHLEPDILVVDEVLAVGDAEFQKKAIGKMQDVAHGGGRTVLFVSHNMRSVRALCSTGIVLNKGQVDYMGTVDECIKHYTESSSSQCTSIDLTNFPRTIHGNGRLKFTKCIILDKNERETNPRCGQPLKIHLEFTVFERIPHARLSVGIRDSYGTCVSTFPTDLTLDGIKLDCGSHQAELIIPKLPLTQGLYGVGMWGGDTQECSDHIEIAMHVQVEDDDFFGHGRMVGEHLKGKVVLCDHMWTIS